MYNAAHVECCQFSTNALPHKPSTTNINPVTFIKLSDFHTTVEGFLTVHNNIRTGMGNNVKIATFSRGNGTLIISLGSRCCYGETGGKKKTQRQYTITQE